MKFYPFVALLATVSAQDGWMPANQNIWDDYEKKILEINKDP